MDNLYIVIIAGLLGIAAAIVFTRSYLRSMRERSVDVWLGSIEEVGQVSDSVEVSGVQIAKDKTGKGVVINIQGSRDTVYSDDEAKNIVAGFDAKPKKPSEVNDDR